MRGALVAAVVSVLGGVLYYLIGTPVIRSYPSPDGTMVVKLTLSRTPGFVAYFRTSRGRGLLSASREEA